VTGARLLIAKLDRLSRDAHFLLGLQKASVKFTACDMPHANELTIGILALVAQNEREAISNRTKAAMAAAKAPGQTFGYPTGADVRQSHRRRTFPASWQRQRRCGHSHQDHCRSACARCLAGDRRYPRHWYYNIARDCSGAECARYPDGTRWAVGCNPSAALLQRV
jgi:Resolvase, N terminal domain